MSGNDLRQFAIGANTGIITVIRSLDREVLTRYQLVRSLHYNLILLYYTVRVKKVVTHRLNRGLWPIRLQALIIIILTRMDYGLD